ncbi:MAG: hypothetical protein IJZ49_10010 [Alistipes sp.]|nr:hypothetical protein [Alistipes sp.]
MKKLILTTIALFVCGQGVLFAQEIKADSLQTTLSEKDILTFSTSNTISEENYKLYPTENMWTFLKLDTRTGKVWQVQYSVHNDSCGEVVVSDKDLTFGSNDKAGRFELYPTQNTYNFILLDKKDGTVVQMQWSMNADYRGLVRIISYGHYD